MNQNLTTWSPRQTEGHETDKQTDRPAGRQITAELWRDAVMKKRSDSNGQVNKGVLGAQTWLGVSTCCVGLLRHQRALCSYSHLSCLLGTVKKWVQSDRFWWWILKKIIEIADIFYKLCLNSHKWSSNDSEIKLYLSETELLLLSVCTKLGIDVSRPRDKCLHNTEEKKIHMDSHI